MSNEELAERIQKGDKKAIPLLWDQVKQLCHWLAYRFGSSNYKRCNQYGITIEDLEQESFFAFLQALKAYSPKSGYTFTTFLKYPMKTSFNNMLGFRTQKGYKDPLSNSVSLSAPTADDESIELSDAIPDEQAEEAFQSAEMSDYIRRLHHDIDTVLGRLNGEERQAIIATFFDNMSMTDAASCAGVDYNRIAALRGSALRKMRNPAIGRELCKYQNDIIDRYGYRGGYNNFRYTFTSSTERAAMKLIEKENFS